MRRNLSLVLVILAIAGWLLTRGDMALSPSEVVGALLGEQNGAAFVVRELRLPPVMGALLAGSAMGLAGLMFQRCLHNNLATPDVIGVTPLASLFVLAGPVIGISHPLALSALAVLGAVLALVAVLTLARDATGGALVLNGVAIGYFALGGINYLLFLSDERSSQRAYGWLVGSTRFASSTDLQWSLPLFLVVLGAAALLIRPMRALELGDEAASALGFAPLRWRRTILALGVLLSGLSTALVGPLAFVGITAPVLARRWVGAERGLELGSALIGALVVSSADASISLFGLDGLPTGVLTGLVGAPLMALLVWHRTAMGVR